MQFSKVSRVLSDLCRVAESRRFGFKRRVGGGGEQGIFLCRIIAAMCYHNRYYFNTKPLHVTCIVTCMYVDTIETLATVNRVVVL